MPVLKATQHERFNRDAIVLDLGDLGRQAAKLRMVAEQKAAALLANAERQAAQMTAGAEAKGFEAGRAKGLEQGLAEGHQRGETEALAQLKPQLDALQASWADAIGQLEAHRQQVQREATQAVIDLALKLSQRLVHRIVEVDATVIVDQVAAALSQVLSPLDVTVAVHPADRPLLEQAMPELTAEFRHLQHIRVVENEEVSHGGCVVSFAEGGVDATLETQFRRIVDLMMPGGGEPAEGATEREPRMNANERE